jgi:hypothetical protein
VPVLVWKSLVCMRLKLLTPLTNLSASSCSDESQMVADSAVGKHIHPPQVSSLCFKIEGKGVCTDSVVVGAHCSYLFSVS